MSQSQSHDHLAGWIPRMVLLCTIVALALALASSAQARTETLRWTHPTPSQVDGFNVYTGSASGSYGQPTDVELPTPSGGIYSVAVDVGDDEVVFAAITAYNADQESSYSNERVLEPPPPPWDPPAGPASLSEGFDGYPSGSNPGGWLDTRAYNSMSGDDSLFSTVMLGDNPVFSTSSTLLNIHSHFATSESETWTSYEYRGRMRISHPDAGIGVTAFSQYPSSDNYYRLRRWRGASYQAFHLAPHPDDVNLTCLSSTTGVSPVANAWYRFRFQVLPEAAATYVRAKVWAESAAEPSSWQVDCFDNRADRLTHGNVGVWSMGSGSKYWDDLEVIDLSSSGGTPGDPGEPPTQEPPLGPPGKPVLIP